MPPVKFTPKKTANELAKAQRQADTQAALTVMRNGKGKPRKLADLQAELDALQVVVENLVAELSKRP